MSPIMVLVQEEVREVRAERSTTATKLAKAEEQSKCHVCGGTHHLIDLNSVARMLLSCAAPETRRTATRGYEQRLVAAVNLFDLVPATFGGRVTIPIMVSRDRKSVVIGVVCIRGV